MSVSPIKIFVSYAHEDEIHKTEFLNHLSGLIKTGVISDWVDAKILPGDNWAEEIKIALEESHVIFFLLSSDFMASNYINNVEIKKALEKQKDRKLRIIPVLIRACDYESTILAQFQLLPRNGKPVNSWEIRDDAWKDVVDGFKMTLYPGKIVTTDVEESVTTEEKKNKNKRKQKGCSVQVLVSFCVLGIIAVVFYFSNFNNNSGFSDKPQSINDTTATAGIQDSLNWVLTHGTNRDSIEFADSLRAAKKAAKK